MSVNQNIKKLKKQLINNHNNLIYIGLVNIYFLMDIFVINTPNINDNKYKTI